MSVFPGLPLTRVMGVINVTPDSFSGDGLLRHSDYIDQAVAQAEQMVQDGAQILDIGGESSRPGAEPISAEEEIRRTAPVIAAIKQKINVPVAIDTVKADVAEAAIQAGATIINDISALTYNARMASVAAQYKVITILMHNRSAPNAVTRDIKIGAQYDGPDYDDVVEDVARELSAYAEAALKEGIAQDKIILDPGIGFGKSVTQNLALITHLERFRKLGFPILMGVSRKSFIGSILDVPVDGRLEGSAACVTACVLNGADIVRVHDVKFMKRVVAMALALRHA